jgi:regulator of nonsense transcripts 2
VILLIRLSELLYLPLPSLPTDSQKYDSILIGGNPSQAGQESDDPLLISGGKWEDEEERRFFEDVQDLRDFVPASVLGIESDEKEKKENDKEKENAEKERAAEEAKKLQEELEILKAREEGDGHDGVVGNGKVAEKTDKDISPEDEDE